MFRPPGGLLINDRFYRGVGNFFCLATIFTTLFPQNIILPPGFIGGSEIHTTSPPGFINDGSRAIGFYRARLIILLPRLAGLRLIGIHRRGNTFDWIKHARVLVRISNCFQLKLL